MSAKNLCKHCALSGTAVCPPGWVRNSVSTSEGVVSCSGFEPKPMVPRRSSKPNLQNINIGSDPKFMGDLRNALGIGRELPKKYTYRSELEAAQARCAELREERALWQSAHDALLVKNERLNCKLAGESNSRRSLLKENAQLHEKRMKALRELENERKKLEMKCKDFSYLQEKWNKVCADRNEVRAELEALKKQHTELCVKHANAGTTINAQEACAKRQDARILSLQNRVDFLERGSYREAIEELGDLVFNGEPDYDPAEVVRAVRELYDALRHFRGESPPQRSDALLLRKLNRIQSERDTARQQRDLAIRDREKSRHRLQRVSERHANCFALLQEAKAERDAAWENRNRFCAALGEIGDLLLGSRDAHAPDAVVHAVRNLIKERDSWRNQVSLENVLNATGDDARTERNEALQELARLREQYERVRTELAQAIARRKPHCDAVWDIGQLILGKGLASYEPATVMSAVRKLCGERNALREERNRLQVECLKRGNERDTLREELDLLKAQALKYAPFQRTEKHHHINAWMRWPYEEAGLKAKQK